MLKDPFYDELFPKAARTFDAEAQNSLLRKAHEYAVDNAEWIWVTHDVNPRAISPKVKGFVQAKSWFQDLTPVTLEK
jgi:ABC-type transport system substrate-binding protein